MTRRKRESWWTLSLQTVPKWSNMCGFWCKKIHRLKAGTTIILRNIICKPDGIDVTSATVIFPAPKTLNLPPYMEKGWPFCISPCWCENCGRSFGISHENQSVRPRENHSGLYPNSRKKDTCVFVHNLTFLYYFLVMVQSFMHEYSMVHPFLNNNLYSHYHLTLPMMYMYNVTNRCHFKKDYNT